MSKSGKLARFYLFVDKFIMYQNALTCYLLRNLCQLSLKTVGSGDRSFPVPPPSLLLAWIGLLSGTNIKNSRHMQS